MFTIRIPCPLQITNKICRSAIGLSMLGEGNCLLSATKYALRQDEKAGPPAILARKSNFFFSVTTAGLKDSETTT